MLTRGIPFGARAQGDGAAYEQQNVGYASDWLRWSYRAYGGAADGPAVIDDNVMQRAAFAKSGWGLDEYKS